MPLPQNRQEAPQLNSMKNTVKRPFPFSSRCALLGVSLLALGACSGHQPIRQKPDGTYELLTKLTFLSHNEEVRVDDLEEAEDFARQAGRQLRVINDSVIHRPGQDRAHVLVFQLFDLKQ